MCTDQDKTSTFLLEDVLLWTMDLCFKVKFKVKTTH